MPPQVVHKMNKVPQTKVLPELWIGHELGVGRTELHNCFQVLLKLWRRVFRCVAKAALCQCLQVLLRGLRAEQTHCTICLGCIQNVVGNGHEGNLLSVKVVVQHLQRLMALLWEASLIHEHYTVDGQLKLAVAALAVDSTRENSLYLIGSSPARTLVEMCVEGLKDSDVTKVLPFGLQPL